MNAQEKIATQVFGRHGLDFAAAERAGGWTNAVWLNGGFALRVSQTEHSDRILREIGLSRHLPEAVGYPPNIEVGTTEGFEWSLFRRIPGVPLSAVWSTLSWLERERAVKRIIDIARGVHSVDIAKAEPFARRRSWFDAFSMEESLAAVEQYAADRIFTDPQANKLTALLTRFYALYHSTAPILNHGDITPDNLMWHEGDVVSLLDFEHSAIVPPGLDWHSIINLAFIPDDNDHFLDRSREASRYKGAVAECLTPLINHPKNADLLLGYAALFRLRFLSFDLQEHGKPDQSYAFRMLCSLIDHRDGYLAFVLGDSPE